METAAETPSTAATADCLCSTSFRRVLLAGTLLGAMTLPSVAIAAFPTSVGSSIGLEAALVDPPVEAPPKAGDPPPSESPKDAPAAEETRSEETPAEEPPAGQPAQGASDDLLRGPKVPEIDVRSDRPYVEGAKDGEKLSKPVLEQRVYFRTIDLSAFDTATKEKIDLLRLAYVERLERFQKVAQKRRAELEAKRKLANPAEPPSEEFKRAMNEIEAERPKLAELQKEVNEVLGMDRARELDKRFAEELKRVRAEQTRLTEAERKRRRAEIEAEKKSRPMGGDGTSGSGSDDPMSPSTPKSDRR